MRPVLAGFFVYSAVNVERCLEELFPDAYPAGKARGKMLVPFIFGLWPAAPKASCRRGGGRRAFAGE